jgi:hypothetical protein
VSHQSHNHVPRVLLGPFDSDEDDVLDDEPIEKEREDSEEDLWSHVAELEDLDDERELGGEA